MGANQGPSSVGGTLSPMSASLRPHRGGTVIALGMASLGFTFASLCVASQGFRFSFLCLIACVIAVPLGALAILLGWRQAAGMAASRIDPTGRHEIRRGQALGAAAIVLALLLTTALIVYFPADHAELRADGASTVTKMYYGHVVKTQYHEVLGSDGHFVKDGPLVLWSRSGKKLEEGSYHDGKRDGPWTIWSEDGSIDETRSGLYQDDVRPGPSPAGDFPVRLRPVGYTERPYRD
jgi:hypothetical protein